MGWFNNEKYFSENIYEDARVVCKCIDESFTKDDVEKFLGKLLISLDGAAKLFPSKVFDVNNFYQNLFESVQQSYTDRLMRDKILDYIGVHPFYAKAQDQLFWTLLITNKKEQGKTFHILFIPWDSSVEHQNFPQLKNLPENNYPPVLAIYRVPTKGFKGMDRIENSGAWIVEQARSILIDDDILEPTFDIELAKLQLYQENAYSFEPFVEVSDANKNGELKLHWVESSQKAQKQTLNFTRYDKKLDIYNDLHSIAFDYARNRDLLQLSFMLGVSNQEERKQYVDTIVAANQSNIRLGYLTKYESFLTQKIHQLENTQQPLMRLKNDQSNNFNKIISELRNLMELVIYKTAEECVQKVNEIELSYRESVVYPLGYNLEHELFYALVCLGEEYIRKIDQNKIKNLFLHLKDIQAEKLKEENKQSRTVAIAEYLSVDNNSMLIPKMTELITMPEQDVFVKRRKKIQAISKIMHAMCGDFYEKQNVHVSPADISDILIPRFGAIPLNVRHSVHGTLLHASLICDINLYATAAMLIDMGINPNSENFKEITRIHHFEKNVKSLVENTRTYLNKSDEQNWLNEIKFLIVDNRKKFESPAVKNNKAVENLILDRLTTLCEYGNAFVIKTFIHDLFTTSKSRYLPELKKYQIKSKNLCAFLSPFLNKVNLIDKLPQELQQQVRETQEDCSFRHITTESNVREVKHIIKEQAERIIVLEQNIPVLKEQADRISVLERTTDELNAAFISQIDEKNTTIQTLENTVEALQRQINELKSQKQALEQKCENIQMQFESIEIQYQLETLGLSQQEQSVAQPVLDNNQVASRL